MRLGFIVYAMNKILSVLVIFIGVCFLSACAGSKPVVEEKVDEPLRDKMVGRVASVNVEAKYVLIQRFGRLDIPDDSILYTLGSSAGGEENVAGIKVTGERLGQFLAADIISGELKVGDAVYLRILETKTSSDLQ